MILVTVGASQFPFDRLLRAVDSLNGGEEVVVQHGPSTVRPDGARCIPFLPMDELAQLIRDARITVTHGGVGSMLLSLENGKRPVVVPRLAAFAETVDDHQLESSRRFVRAGLVTLVEDPADLPTAIAALDSTISVRTGGPNRLVTELRQYLGTTVGRPVSNLL